jgi:hypothetical protein
MATCCIEPLGNVPPSLQDSTSEVVLVVIAAALAALGLFIVFRIRRKPKDKEMRRRLNVNLHGRLGDATITEVQDNTIYYSYSVRGVTYTASQDIAQLRAQISSDLEKLIGPASLKYSPRNPANSIIVCEEWSGLRARPPADPPVVTG